LFVVLVSGYVC